MMTSGRPAQRSVFRTAGRLALAALTALAIVAPATPALGDDIRDEQWQLTYLRADEAWPEAQGEGVTVAVIDSGVDATHPDLAGQILPGRDFVDSSTDGRSDPVGHGTTVSGLIAGRGDDSEGVEGIAPHAKILPVRVLDANNQYDSATLVADAVIWAVDNGADVINMSIGSAESTDVLTDALYYAFDQDVIVVACNGNYSNERGTQVWHPAREAGVVAVSGVNSDGEFWDGSLSGPETVLAAPAAGIIGAQPGGGYAEVQGTSFAAPLVAGAAALVRSEYPQMSAANVINRLISTAWDAGAPGYDSEFGYGIVNPARALTAQVTSVQRSPLLPNAPAPTHDAGGPSGPRTTHASHSVAPHAAGEPSRRNPTMALALLAVIVVTLTGGAIGATALTLRHRAAQPVHEWSATPTTATQSLSLTAGHPSHSDRSPH